MFLRLSILMNKVRPLIRTLADRTHFGVIATVTLLALHAVHVAVDEVAGGSPD